jgi:aspartate aminotransferase-like enzyme
MADCFRIGSIGEVYPKGIQALLEAVNWAIGFLPDSGK